MKIKNLPAEERPLEKSWSQGVESLSNGELLALLINSGTKDKSALALAEEVLARDESGLAYLGASTMQELMTVPGIGRAGVWHKCWNRRQPHPAAYRSDRGSRRKWSHSALRQS